MNARLQAILAHYPGLTTEKAVELLDLFNGNVDLIESVLGQAEHIDHKAKAMGVAYKTRRMRMTKQDTGELDDLDNAYVALRDAMDAGDRAAIQAALGQMQQLAVPADENEIATKLLGAANGTLANDEKPIKAKARKMDLFEAAVKYGMGDLRPRR